MYRFYSKDTDKMKRVTTPGYIGVDPILVYYKKYKQLDKELEHGPQGYSACTAHLSQIKSMKVLPTTLGLISPQHKAEEGQIKAANLKMGSNYA